MTENWSLYNRVAQAKAEKEAKAERECMKNALDPNLGMTALAERKIKEGPHTSVLDLIKQLLGIK